MSTKAVEIYKQYAAAWAAISDQERRAILDTVLEADIVYRIPRMEGTGHAIVLEDIGEFQAKFPGGKFVLYSVSEHHDVALMEWQLILPDGTPSVRGHDAVRVTPAGKLGQIITFAPSTSEL
jgi:hypothetical protein